LLRLLMINIEFRYGHPWYHADDSTWKPDKIIDLRAVLRT